MKVKIGIFVLVGLSILASIIFYIGRDKNMFQSALHANALFTNIGGLEVGNHVRFLGINIGVVDGIRIFSDTSVIVDLLINSDAGNFIRKDAIAFIGSDGLMGDKNLVISQGSPTAKLIGNRHRFIVREPMDMDAMMVSLGNTSENAEIITSELAEILFKVNHGNGTLARLISDSTFSEDLSATMYNLKQGSGKLDENMEAAKNSILFRGYFKKKKKANTIK